VQELRTYGDAYGLSVLSSGTRVGDNQSWDTALYFSERWSISTIFSIFEQFGYELMIPKKYNGCRKTYVDAIYDTLLYCSSPFKLDK